MQRIQKIVLGGLVLLLVGYNGVRADNQNVVAFKTVQQIAVKNAQSIWGETFSTEPIPYYDLNDQLIAYMFNFRKGQMFPAHREIMERADKAESKKDRWGVKEYCHILVSATPSQPPILEYCEGLSDEFAYGYKIEERAKEALGTYRVELVRIYLIDLLIKWYVYTDGRDTVCVKIFPPPKVYSFEEFNRKVRNQYRTLTVSSTKAEKYATMWDEYESGKTVGSSGRHYIPARELMPYYDWSYGCSPTAATMLLAYWSNWGMAGRDRHNYARLVQYHFKRWDSVQGEWDYQVPDLQRALAIAMETDSMTGFTYSADINNGIEDVCEDRGYDFEAENRWTLEWSRLKEQIDEGRPLIGNVPGHSMTVIGYDDDDDLICAHNTWNPGEDWAHWDKDDIVGRHKLITRVYPDGGGSASIQLGSPLGDTGYNHHGDGDTLYKGKTNLIIWYSENIGYGSVKIYYSLDGGINWHFLTETGNNHGYEWNIPLDIEDTEYGRIKIEWYSPSGHYIGGDGSLGDFYIMSSANSLFSGMTFVVDTVLAYFRYRRLWRSPFEAGTWDVVGMKLINANDPGKWGWSMGLYADTLFQELEFVTAMGPGNGRPGDSIAFIASYDGHNEDLGWKGVMVQSAVHSSGEEIWVQRGKSNSLGLGENSGFEWDSSDVVKIWDINLFEEEEYQFELDITEGNADLGMALFQPTGSVCRFDKADAVAISDTAGPGRDEGFTARGPGAGYFSTYGLVVWSKNSESCEFDINILTEEDSTMYSMHAGSPYFTNTNPTYCLLVRPVQLRPWAAIGMQPMPGADWNIFLFTDNPLNIPKPEPVTFSDYGGSYLDILLINYLSPPLSLNSADSEYIMLSRASGGKGVWVQYVLSEGELKVGTNQGLAWTQNDGVKIWGLDLVEGSSYKFTLVNPNKDAKLGMAIFNPNSRYQNRSQAAGGTIGSDESFSFDAAYTGTYGVLVYAYKLGSTTFSINITPETGTEEELPPLSYALLQNSPNPVLAPTTISYQVPEPTDVNLKIYNSSGQIVKTLVNARKHPGSYDVVWNGKDDRGMKVPQGIYFCRLETRGYQAIKKLILLR